MRLHTETNLVKYLYVLPNIFDMMIPFQYIFCLFDYGRFLFGCTLGNHGFMNPKCVGILYPGNIDVNNSPKGGFTG